MAKPRPGANVRVGKIAALPESIRSEINQRLLNGELSPQILPWLNGHQTVKLILDERFNAAAITLGNLSDWRQGGYRDWLKSSERLQQTKALAQYAAELARTNGARLAEGAQAIAGGRILALLEASGGNMPKDELADLVTCLTNLRSSEIAQQRADQQGVKLKQNERAFRLEREKFEMVFCSKLLDAARLEKTRLIAEGTGTNEEKIKALRQAYFADVDLLEKSGEVQLPK